MKQFMRYEVEGSADGRRLFTVSAVAERTRFLPDRSSFIAFRGRGSLDSDTIEATLRDISGWLDYQRTADLLSGIDAIVKGGPAAHFLDQLYHAFGLAWAEQEGHDVYTTREFRAGMGQTRRVLAAMRASRSSGRKVTLVVFPGDFTGQYMSRDKLRFASPVAWDIADEVCMPVSQLEIHRLKTQLGAARTRRPPDSFNKTELVALAKDLRKKGLIPDALVNHSFTLVQLEAAALYMRSVAKSTLGLAEEASRLSAGE